jgi:hypothetical protein
MGEDVIGGRCPSWQAMVSVKNFHRSARARPPPADTPDESSAVTTSQVTPSTQDFAVSLVPGGVLHQALERVDAAEPDLDGAGAKVGDGSVVTVCDLSLLIDLKLVVCCI